MMFSWWPNTNAHEKRWLLAHAKSIPDPLTNTRSLVLASLPNTRLVCHIPFISARGTHSWNRSAASLRGEAGEAAERASGMCIQQIGNDRFRGLEGLNWL